MSSRFKRVLVELAPLLVLALVNYATFARHFRDKSTFPWDFLGGYHAQAFGWFDAGSVVSPPAWLPWSDMGFPAFLAIQSGAWYLPLALLDAAGVTYTVHVATVLQVLHVLLGAIGTYCLGRILGWGRGLALVGAVAYHYGATFYSNQQHVDIIRAAAWIPWLLVSLHPNVLTGRKWGVLLSAFVLSQLLISGYPGNIIAAAYACAIWVLVSLEGISGRRHRLNYAFLVAASVLAGTLMAMPKWLPVAMLGGSGLGMERVEPSPIMLHHLFTLIMPYEFDRLSGDVTMRALWLPLAILWGMAFADLRDRMVVLGLAFVALALFMGFAVPRAEFLQAFLPGARTSRFPVSDWRPVLHIGLILVGMAGWKRLLEGQLVAHRVVLGAFGTLALFGVGVVAAIKFGYPAVALPRVLAVLFTLMAASIAMAFYRPYGASMRWAATLPVLLLATTALDGYYYYRSQPTTWRPDWNTSAELASFGGEFSSFVAQQPHGPALQRRPARYLMGKGAEEILRQRNNSFYNRCWYAHSFCTFGYNNLRLSEPHRRFAESVAGEGGDRLAAFASRPQQLLLLEIGAEDRVPEGGGLDSDSAFGDTEGVSVAFATYASDLVEYRISTTRERVVVENEIWWPGWEVTLCSKSGCGAAVAATPTSQSLRSWKVPAGTWLVKVRYHPPSMLPAYLCFLIGLLLAIGSGFLMLRSKTDALARPLDSSVTPRR